MATTGKLGGKWRQRERSKWRLGGCGPTVRRTRSGGGALSRSTPSGRRERRGIVRWMRPEFQNPTGAKPSMQADLELPAAAERRMVKPAAKTAWPKSINDQALAVRAARPAPA